MADPATQLNNWQPGRRSDLVRRVGDRYVLRRDGREVVRKADMEQKLRELERAHPTISKARFLLVVQQKYANISRRDVDRYKGSSQKYSRSLPVKRNFRGAVRSVFSQHRRAGSALGFDLIDNAQRRDGSYGFILVAADVFSRRCWLFPLTTKRATGNEQQLLQSKTVLAAMRSIFNEHEFKFTLSDNGSEFKGLVTTFLQSKGVTMIKSRSYSGGIRFIESMNHQVRKQLARAKAARERTGAWHWARALPAIEKELNETPHSGTKLPPMQVWNRARAGQPNFDVDVHRFVLMRNMSQAQKVVETSSEKLGAPLVPGDKVRLALTALSSAARRDSKARGGTFEKPSERQNWTRRIFTIKSASKGTSTSQRRYMVVLH